MSDRSSRTPRPRTRSTAAIDNDDNNDNNDNIDSPITPSTKLPFETTVIDEESDDDGDDIPAPPPFVPSSEPVDSASLQVQMVAILQLLAEATSGRNRGVSTASTRESKEPKVKDPETFNGKRDQLNAFITECNLVFELQPSRFSDERVKVNYMISYLRGTPLEAVRPYLNARPRPRCITDYDEFITYLRSNFGDPDEIGTTRRKYKSLCQTGPASAYFSELQQYLAILGYKDQDPIVDHAIDGLKSWLKDELARRPRPTTFVELREFVIPLDNRIYERDQEKKKEKDTTSDSSSKTTNNTSMSTPSAKHNDQRTSSKSVTETTAINKSADKSTQLATKSPTGGYTSQSRPPLSQEEKDRRRRENLCSYCGGPGHFATDCPNAKKSNFTKTTVTNDSPGKAQGSPP